MIFSPRFNLDRIGRLLGLLLLLHAGGVVHAADEPLLTASAGEHVWYVTKDPVRPATWRLMHHARGMDGPYARVARSLDARPFAIAATADRLLLAMPQLEGGGTSLDLIGLRVRRNPAMGSYFDQPLDAWEVLANIPEESPLAGLEFTTGETPLVLLLPEKRVSAGVQRSGGNEAERAPPLHTRLLRQVGFQWAPLELPEALHSLEEQYLLPNAGLAEASILAAADDGTAELHRLQDGVWTSSALEMPFAMIKRVVRIGDHLALAATDGSDGLKIFVERGQSLLPVTRIETPEGAWGLAAAGESILLLSVLDDGESTVRSIDPMQGVVGEPLAWVRPPLDVSDWLHLPIIGMMVVAALLAIVLFRPSEAPDMPLRAGVVPLPLSRRLCALAIDFVPGVLLVLVLFGPQLSRVSTIPLWSTELAFAGPGAVVIGVTLLHEAVSELIWRRSLGKAIMGGEVLAANGTRASAVAVLLRILFKAVVVYAPILAVFVILSPALQGVPETVSRTVVADARSGQNLPDPK